MKAIILAAGYATRLYPLTENQPKCLLKVGDKTILDSICEKLNAVPEIDEIILVTNAKFFDQLNAWKDHTHSRAKIQVINDGTTSNDTRLGAIGDLGLALKKAGVTSDFLMMASDNLFEQDLAAFVRFAHSKKNAVSIAVYDIQDPSLAAKKFGVIEADSTGKVTRIEEKPEKPRSSLIGMGVYYFPASSLPLVTEYLSHKDAQDAPGHYIRWLTNKTEIFSFLFSGLWYDIGDLKALEDANNLFKKNQSKRAQ